MMELMDAIREVEPLICRKWLFIKLQEKPKAEDFTQSELIKIRHYLAEDIDYHDSELSQLNQAWDIVDDCIIENLDRIYDAKR